MIVADPTQVGPHNPVPSVPPRAPHSIRRTSTIDTFRPEGFDGSSQVIAHARDLITNADGAPGTRCDAHLEAVLDPRIHILRSIETDPPLPGVQQLVGALVGPGFRKQVDVAVPELIDSGSGLYLLLDDLPGATLVSGYSMLHAGAIPRGTNDEYLIARSDLCAGWADEGVMMSLIREHGESPATQGPDAPLLTSDDPDAWHPLLELPPNAMRRLRRIDVTRPEAGQASVVDVFFRDSHVDSDGRETIVHEYSVDATVDPVARTVLSIDARADVLPWHECPGALGSASRLVGMPLAGLRPWIRQTFTGTSTCTHLNDVLRGLTDVSGLLDTLAAEE